MKKIILALIVIVAVFGLMSGCSAKDKYEQELVVNGNFESETDYDGWTKQNGSSAIFSMVNTNIGSDQYNVTYGINQLELNSGYYDNWLYLTQEIEVVRGGIYKLQVSINVSEVITSDSETADLGAYVGFAEDSGIKRVNIVEITDGWETYIVYFSPVSDNILNIQIGLGTAAAPANGTARFDNLSLTRVETAPINNEVYNVGSGTGITRSNTAGIVYVVIFAIISALACYLAYILIRRFMALYPSMKGGEEILNNGRKIDIATIAKSPVFIMSAVMIIAFILRLLIVNKVYGHTSDMNTFANWASRLAEYGPTTFYQNVTTTYPPGYLYILWALGGIAKLLGLSSGTLGMAIFLKIPAIVCDIIVVYLLFVLASKHFNMYIAAVISGLYAILPVIFTNSAAWGQMDAVYTLFVLLTFIAILDKKYISVIIYFAIAAYLRADVLILMPLVASFLVYIFIKNKEDRIKLCIAISAAILLGIAISLPFTIKMDGASIIFYIFGRYAAAAVANPVFSSNAFNFYGVFNLNMQTVTSFARVLSWVIYLVLAFYVSFIYFYKRNRAELLLLAGFLMSAVYVFSTAMTGQAMFMAFALILAYIAISGEKRILLIFSVLALTNFINLAQLLNQSGYIGSGANSALISYIDHNLFMIIFGVINFFTVIYFALVTYDICYSDDIRELEPMNNNYIKTMIDYFKGVKSIFISGNNKKK